MFVDYKTMESLGYEIIPNTRFKGINFRYMYHKYFPNNNSIVLFDSYSNIINTIFLSENNYKLFQDDKIAITLNTIFHDTNSSIGKPMHYAMHEVVGGVISDNKMFKETLLRAEQKAENKELSNYYINNCLLFRNKIIEFESNTKKSHRVANSMA